MDALEAFTTWLASYTYRDRRHRLPIGAQLSIHSRSDAHSVQLAQFMLAELLDRCPVLHDQARQGEIGYGLNYRFHFPNGKTKTLDLAIGQLLQQREPPVDTRIHRLHSRGGHDRTLPDTERFARLLIACELKSVLTEHRKSAPRVFDELNGSHAIVHAGSRDTIAAGITLINIADTFVSPLRQRPDQPLQITSHRQPADAADMISHLRQLPRRGHDQAIGFDAYCSFVMQIDNQGLVALWTAPPAPQPSDLDHFDWFLADICHAYTQRFSNLATLPEPGGLSAEEALRTLARRYPGLLDETGRLAVDADLTGAPELRAILQAIELQVRSETGA